MKSRARFLKKIYIGLIFIFMYAPIVLLIIQSFRRRFIHQVNFFDGNLLMSSPHSIIRKMPNNNPPHCFHIQNRLITQLPQSQQRILHQILRFRPVTYNPQCGGHEHWSHRMNFFLKYLYRHGLGLAIFPRRAF